MLIFLDKDIIEGLFNSNEFKGWLLSRRWFGDKSALSNLEFNVSFEYFEIISERILITVIKIETSDYTKPYFLPLVYYKKITDILESSEKIKKNVVRITNNTFSKKIAITIENEQKVLDINLVEAEFCLFFWKKMLFDKELSEKFPSLSLDLTLYTEQFEDEINMKKVQNLIEASLYPDRYELSLKRLGKGNTTNTLFLLNITNKRNPDEEPISYVLKSYKEYSESREPSTLFVLVKKKYPNAPKIYGTIKFHEKESIGIIENATNIGNLGEIYWNELNEMVKKVFKEVLDDYSGLQDKTVISNLIEEYCVETLKVSYEIGKYIKNLHEFLILPEDKDYSIDTVDSKKYLESYTEKLNEMISELQNIISQHSEGAIYNLPKIGSILIDTKDIIENFRSEFKEPTIRIQPVHQDLHMEQILYNKTNDHYNFYFIDFEGDPQLSIEEKKRKFPIEKDLASFLRALSYIKFNTFLAFIESKIIRKGSFEVPEEILYSIFFRKTVKPINKILEAVLTLLNKWENKLIRKILQGLEPNITLINYFYIERTLHEITYEILYRPNKIIVPVLGLKEIIEKG